MNNENHIQLNVKSVGSGVGESGLMQVESINRLTKDNKVVYRGHLYALQDGGEIPYIIYERPLQKLV